ncbi:hypothetical protein MNBD_BACTEROID01-2446 [hydrothermal vent metagenome]|uniref:Carbohydrate-binding domain-containing protein n=1 Tax=hydrothermal vent metagenome TaxID=652676 RepID=A0A3B0TH94_9ZZZZ
MIIEMKPIFQKLYLFAALLVYFGLNNGLYAGTGSEVVLKVKKSQDFEVAGDGSSIHWKITEWVNLPQRNTTSSTYTTKVKVLYSETGIYFLFDCEDKKLTSTMRADNMDLYEEDVVEVFLWTEEEFPVYFEYELSPLNYELPIIIPNNKGRFFGWLPWHYEGERKTRHSTSVRGGAKESGAAVTGWMAEFFIPYKLLAPLKNVPPKPGARWRANMYRIDYDEGMATFSWQKTEKTFHDYNSFGTFVFE